MSSDQRLKYLRIALVVFGLGFLGIYPMTLIWPEGWAWGMGHASHYLPMLVSVYVVLGVFLLIAAGDPARHASLIWFTVWSSILHAGVMAAQALSDAGERGHLIGDVPALLAAGVVLAVLAPRRPSPSPA